MKEISAAIIITTALFLLPAAAFAQPLTGGSGSSGTTVNPAGQYEVKNPLGTGTNSICGLIKKVLQAALAIGIPVAVLFIVYAGFKFVMAQGNAEALKEARQNFMWTLIGIGIFLGAWLLAQVVANTINAIQQGSGNPSAISCQ